MSNSEPNARYSPDRGSADPVDFPGEDANGGVPAQDAQNDLVARLARAEDEAASMKDAWLRAKAESDNVRKQAQNDITKAQRYAIERFAQDLLEVKDALETALGAGLAPAAPGEPDTLRAGVELTLKNLQAAFERAQVVEINPAAGEKYDPHRHQAMTMVDAPQPANTVVQLFQKGYLLNDRVLRPALVSVAKGDSTS